MARKRVAIVGSGCAGIGALWALKSTDHDVHLFEADSVLGGHTNTVAFKHEGREVDVDTGFIVFNTATYPNFINFLSSLGVESVPTEMTFGVSRDYGAFEWAGTSLGAVFAQWSNMFNPRMWRMLFDIVRFNQFALDILHVEDESEANPSGANGVNGANGANGSSHAKVKETEKAPSPHAMESVGEYLARQGYSHAFRDEYLIPMTAAVWSTGPEKCALDFPVITLVRFMWNHHLLTTVGERPQWKTIPGGSRKYIDAVLQDFPKEKIHLENPVIAVEDINEKVILQFENDDEELFDHVILACHGNQALNIVSDSGTEEEVGILGAFQTSENIAYMHSDITLMPRNRKTWSSWNLLTTTNCASRPSDSTAMPPPPDKVSLTYNMNILQHIPTSVYGDVLVTLNPPHPPSPPECVQRTFTYHHPLYTPASVRAQKQLPRIQNRRGISYAGAWTRYGFHEDGFSSGVKVAVDHLGATLPWEFVDSTFSRGKKPPRLTWGEWFMRGFIRYLQFWVGAGDWIWGVVVWLLGFLGLDRVFGDGRKAKRRVLGEVQVVDDDEKSKKKAT